MEKIYKLEKPDVAQLKVHDVMFKIFKNKNPDMKQVLYATSFPNYLYWDKFKYLTIPDLKLSKEEAWFALKNVRKFQSVETPIIAENGQRFMWYNKLPGLEAFFHEVDLNTGGSLTAFTTETDDKSKYKFMSRGILEEAIASSQLEGANTTRKVAKKFLLEGRSPSNPAERMILNNYKAMKELENTYKKRKLDKEMLFELHSMIVDKTVKDSEKNRYRTDEDEVVVVDKKDQSIVYHIPPKVAFLEVQMSRLIDFANDNRNEYSGQFMHPIIKAIIVHFWVGYLHPFTDGNGRLARLLFYWVLLKENYWAFIYLPISYIIKNSAEQYRFAYLYSEQDDNDLTYFIHYNIQKIKSAVTDFRKYVEDKANENKKMNKLAKEKYKLNDRQIQLLQYFIEEKHENTTPKTYQHINQVSKKTALNDLKTLENLGFIHQTKIGRNTFYSYTQRINELFIVDR